ncbi:MAG: hypothetical protein LBP52_02685, partial [Burkholderiaceae bacterium]|nr:hypothetical protein [Burkholderiaceae bacterium]
MHINTPSRMNARTLITLTALLASGGYAFGACDSDASGGKVSVTSGSSCTAGYSSYAIANEYDSAAVLAQGPGSVL